MNQWPEHFDSDVEGIRDEIKLKLVGAPSEEAKKKIMSELCGQIEELLNFSKMLDRWIQAKAHAVLIPKDVTAVAKAGKRMRKSVQAEVIANMALLLVIRTAAAVTSQCPMKQSLQERRWADVEWAVRSSWLDKADDHVAMVPLSWSMPGVLFLPFPLVCGVREIRESWEKVSTEAGNCLDLPEKKFVPVPLFLFVR